MCQTSLELFIYLRGIWVLSLCWVVGGAVPRVPEETPFSDSVKLTH